MNTLKNNKSIAEFMGGKQTDRGYFIPYWCLVNMDSIDSGKGRICKYHKSWDWLMPVLEKIESIYICTIKVTTFGTSIKIFNLKDDTCFECYPRLNTDNATKLSVTYKAVVRFLDWVNQDVNQPHISTLNSN